MSTAVIFVGPSLPDASLLRRTGIEFRPPARRGDVEKAADDGAIIVGLVDGVFLQNRAVPPSEILDIARRGNVRLYGAASLGALRAAECPGAMTGIGEVFAMFSRGELTDDDEVAQTYEPTSFRTVAFPLVRVRKALRIGCAGAMIGRDEAEAILRQVRALPFDERDRPHVERISAAVLGGGRSASFVAILECPESDIKATDAGALIVRVEAELLGSTKQS